MEKEVFDARGRMQMIFRLLDVSKEAFIHILFYRIAILFGLITAALIALSLLMPSLTAASYASMLIMWVLLLPQLFEVSKVLPLVVSKGIVFGKLNTAYLASLDRKEIGRYGALGILPYAVLLAWSLLLVLFAVNLFFFKINISVGLP